MGNLRKSFVHSGYDREEAYFHQEDQRLIEKQRNHLKLVSSQTEAELKSKMQESAEVVSLPQGSSKGFKKSA